MTRKLRAFTLDGINVDSLGHYLAGLGVLSAAAQRWPTIRACWHQGRFKLLSDEAADLNEITKFLLTEWTPTPYERWWSTAQKADTKAKTSFNLWDERNARSIEEVRLVDAHVVGLGRNCFNPVLGTGGNVGKRDLAKAWNDAAKLLKKPERGEWLEATLTGRADCSMPDLASGGTWFVFANKTFNSGQGWYREGQLSPWSVLLSMEGAFLLTGGVNRRMGSRSRPYAVFPFVSDPAQPETDGEIGMARAEFWAPLWEYPATVGEVSTLLQRGLARIGGRAASAPAEFAVAALSTGVDAGVTEFARFELRQTTSSQVFEAIPRERIAVGHGDDVRAKAARQLGALIESGWMNRFPFEPRDSKQKGKFVGLSGPIEAAILRIGERPDEATRWQSLLLAMTKAQTRIDRNKGLRDRCIPLRTLAPEWFDLAWHPDDPLPLEIEVARAIASIGWQSNSSDLPLLANVFGLETQHDKQGNIRTTRFPKARPPAAVWGSGSPLSVMLDVAHRRLVDATKEDSRPFLNATNCACRAATIQHLLRNDGTLDLEEIIRWVPVLALIDWSKPSRSQEVRREDGELDGTSLLHALVRPLFHGRNLELSSTRNEKNLPLFPENPLTGKAKLPPPGLLRRLFNLLRFNSLDEVLQVLQDRYRAAGHEIVMPPLGFEADGEVVAAALLIPMSNADVEHGLRRWLQPRKESSSRSN